MNYNPNYELYLSLLTVSYRDKDESNDFSLPTSVIPNATVYYQIWNTFKCSTGRHKVCQCIKKKSEKFSGDVCLNTAN